jgi:hypothetical protein
LPQFTLFLSPFLSDKEQTLFISLYFVQKAIFFIKQFKLLEFFSLSQKLMKRKKSMFPAFAARLKDGGLIVVGERAEGAAENTGRRRSS